MAKRFGHDAEAHATFSAESSLIPNLSVVPGSWMVVTTHSEYEFGEARAVEAADSDVE